MIEVIRSGPLTTVQDLGRPGLAHLGVGRSGAADRTSLRLANRLVGNRESRAALETTFGGLSVRFTAGATVAVTGAPLALRVEGRQRADHAPFYVEAGTVLELGVPSVGVRSYLAVRGGIAVPKVLGSRSTDLLAQLGPDRLAAGDCLPVGRARGELPGIDHVAVPGLPVEPSLRVVPGPRVDWFTESAWQTLGSTRFEVSDKADRVGVRLVGAGLERARDGELLSEGLVDGAIQVPPDGNPVVFLADHPVTGGYPVIGVVHPEDLALVAQLRPGQGVRFTLQPPLPIRA
ncbi:MAG: biotin-dependent carboxyltransferase family protein [Dermatophilaceae bacterium]|nr:biotin-dependent carboxyltransferase family protein [Dermatophilaceae bacterium]